MQIQALDSRRDVGEQADEAVYRFSRAIPRLSGVTAALAYLAPTTERPYNYMYEPPAGTARENCEYRMNPVWITDARAMASPPSIHTAIGCGARRFGRPRGCEGAASLSDRREYDRNRRSFEEQKRQIDHGDQRHDKLPGGPADRSCIQEPREVMAAAGQSNTQVYFQHPRDRHNLE
jgi:hypothetical protein